jgi:hypothetical protein
LEKTYNKCIHTLLQKSGGGWTITQYKIYYIHAQYMLNTCVLANTYTCIHTYTYTYIHNRGYCCVNILNKPYCVCMYIYQGKFVLHFKICPNSYGFISQIKLTMHTFRHWTSVSWPSTDIPFFDPHRLVRYAATQVPVIRLVRDCQSETIPIPIPFQFNLIQL